MGANGGFGSWHHLAKRFFGALSPVGPAPADEEWAQSHLLNGERTVWRRMSGPDRRHAVGVARDAIRLLQPAPAPREVVAAALLHDSGKVESSLGTFMRAGVTFIAVVVGRTRLLRWAGDLNGRRSWRARIGLYLTHDRVGADLLDRAGSHPLTVSWTSEHHMAPELWTVDATVGAALKAADGD